MHEQDASGSFGAKLQCWKRRIGKISDAETISGALRSVECPAPPLGCLRDVFSLVWSLHTVKEDRSDKRFCAMRRRKNT